MTPDDTQDFFDSWDQCAELYGKEVSSDAKELAFKLLVRYSLVQVKAALQAHMSDPDGGRFMPKPADVIGKIQVISPSGFPGAEQAWAQFPRDEIQSACICEEMAKAWGIACELDAISGRMAFKEAYAREVQRSKAMGKAPQWYISTGTCKQQREQVTLDAVRDCLISPQAARVHLPHIPADELSALSRHEVTPNKLIESHAQTVASMDQLLLTGPDDLPAADAAKAREHIAQMREVLR